MNKSDQIVALFQFLVTNDETIVTLSSIQAVTGWKAGTVKTYIHKKWAGVLTPQGEGEYLVSLQGIELSQFVAATTQNIIPPRTPAPSKYDYDVALSFAGEDRDFVQEVASILKAYGISVFYDTYETQTLWGKDLYTHLDEVYRTRSKYCMMFISVSYSKKLWTNHERQSAQARAFEERQEYILPVRLDSTEIPGIRPTVGYIDGKSLGPQQVAILTAQKLGAYSEFENLMTTLEAYLTGYTITQVGDQIEFHSETEGAFYRFSIAMMLEAMRADQLDFVFFRSSIFVQ